MTNLNSLSVGHCKVCTNGHVLLNGVCRECRSIPKHAIPVRLNRRVRFAVQNPNNPLAYRLLDESGNYLMEFYQFQVDAHRITVE